MKSVKRLVGIVLSCVLFAGLMPGDVYAEGGDGERKTVSVSSFQELDLQIMFAGKKPVTIQMTADDDNANRNLTIESGQDVVITSDPASTENRKISFSKNVVITVEPDAVLAIDRITLDGASELSSLIQVEEGGTLIVRNSAVLEGSLHTAVKNEGSFTLDSSTIQNSCLSDGYSRDPIYGGGVYNSGSFTMINGRITANCMNGNKTYGGGVYNSGVFNMKSGTIDNNMDTNNETYGGGVYNDASGTFTMDSGTIKGNTVGMGDGAGVYNEGTFYMKGGTIEESSMMLGNGGGVYNSSIFEMSGGTITKNISGPQNGGGVYNAASGSFTMKGSSTIEGNEAFFSGGGVYNDGIFAMEQGTVTGNEVSSYGGGIYNGTAGTFTMNGGRITKNTALAENPSAGTMNRNKGGGIFNNGTFTMYDGEISENRSGQGGGVQNGLSMPANVKGGDFVMEGGVISGNSALFYGGGVYIDENGGTFSMNDGEIRENTAEYNGGGIFIDTRSTATIRKGRIESNTANGKAGGGYAGGGIYVNQSSSDEKENGTLYLYNAAVYHNTSKLEGSGIAACPYSNVKVYVTNGGLIYGNTGENGESLPQVYMQTPYETLDRVHEVFLSRYMLGGGSYNWTDKDGNLLTDEQLYNAGTIAAYNTLADGDASVLAALSKATVFITGNISAERGGGIGCNGNLIIGTEEPITDYGNLKIKKTVAGTTELSQFEFTIVLEDGSHAPYLEKIDAVIDEQLMELSPDENGSIKLSLSAGSEIELVGLPAGMVYTVTETEVPGCRVTINGESGKWSDSGDIRAEETVEVSFLNDFRPVTENPESSDSDKESDPQAGKDSGDSHNPQTGDFTSILPVTGILLSSLMLFGAAVYSKKRIKTRR